MKAFAEWQAQERLLISLPHAQTDWAPYLGEILDGYFEFARAVSRYQSLLIIHHKDTDISRFARLDGVEFFAYECDDTWIRDYASIDVMDDDGGVVSYDFVFNAWGGKYNHAKDNALNAALHAQKLNTKLKQIDLILEGGSIDINSSGIMLTTTNCLLNANRNNLDKASLDARLKELFGLKDIVWLEHGCILGDDTDSHVDTLARWLDDDTIAYAACYDSDDEHYEHLRAMELELERYARASGARLVPLEIPGADFYDGKRLPYTYLNFVFINGALIVPTYACKHDQIALDKLRAVVKDRDVVGVDARVFCRQNGSLHCSCMNKYKPLR